MQGPVIIFLLIVVISAVIGAVSQVIKNVQQAPPPNRPRAGGGGGRDGGGEIDRFLEEIDRLRRKKAQDSERTDRGSRSESSEPPVAQPVERRRNEPKRRRKPVPEAKPVPVASVIPGPRLEDLPVAPPVVHSDSGKVHQVREVKPLPIGATDLSTPITDAMRHAPKTDFARALGSMLSDPQSVPLAIVLQEVLGPPKCRRG